MLGSKTNYHKEEKLRQTLLEKWGCDCGELDVYIKIVVKKMKDLDERIFDE
jgi:hypothetical protein